MIMIRCGARFRPIILKTAPPEMTIFRDCVPASQVSHRTGVITDGCVTQVPAYGFVQRWCVRRVAPGESFDLVEQIVWKPDVFVPVELCRHLEEVSTVRADNGQQLYYRRVPDIRHRGPDRKWRGRHFDHQLG